MPSYEFRYMLGRCSNGAERDKGRIIHALPITNGRYAWKALCGKEPGRTSAGWTEYPQDKPDCPRCLKLMALASA